MPSARRRLGVMAKYWRPGYVKTRLGRSIGMDQAAAVHRSLLAHLLVSLEPLSTPEVGGRDAIATSIVFWPEDERHSFSQWLESGNRSGWNLEAQCPGDLGSRMRHWFEEHLIGVMDQAVLIGADCPDVDPNSIVGAFAALRKHDLVLGPAADGGYYLIGLRGPFGAAHRGLFDKVAWGTSQVRQTTIERATASGLGVETLTGLSDVDTEADLKALLDRPDLHIRLRRELEQILGVQHSR